LRIAPYYQVAMTRAVKHVARAANVRCAECLVQYEGLTGRDKPILVPMQEQKRQICLTNITDWVGGPRRDGTVCQWRTPRYPLDEAEEWVPWRRLRTLGIVVEVGGYARHVGGAILVHNCLHPAALVQIVSFVEGLPITG